MLYSVVDVGSNTVRIVTYEINDTSIKPVYTNFCALGLISRIKDRKMSTEAIDALCKVLSEFKENSPKGAVFIAFATAFLRATENPIEIVNIVKNRTGIELEILSEQDEAICSFKGMTRSLNLTNGLAVDFGGGSCEFIKFENKAPVLHKSLPFGCVKLADMFVKSKQFATKQELEHIYDYVTSQLSLVEWVKNSNALVITGGTARAIAQMDNYINKTASPLSNYILSMDNYDTLYNNFTTLDQKYIDFVSISMPSRIKTIYPGLASFKAIFDYTSCKEITISTEGVREGYLSYILGR